MEDEKRLCEYCKTGEDFDPVWSVEVVCCAGCNREISHPTRYSHRQGSRTNKWINLSIVKDGDWKNESDTIAKFRNNMDAWRFINLMTEANLTGITAIVAR